MQLQTNYIEIKLFGEDLILSERTALDTYLLVELTKDLPNDYESVVLVNSLIVYDALKINFKRLKFYQLIKWIKYKRIINRRNLIEKLSFGKLEWLANKVLELEGIKKKSIENNQEKQSAEELHGV